MPAPKARTTVIHGNTEEEVRRLAPPALPGYKRQESLEPFPPHLCYQFRLQIVETEEKG